MLRLKSIRRYTTSEYAKHSKLLSSLGLESMNQGVFDGSWKEGKGELVHSINPATNNIIASVRQATPEQLQNTLKKMEKIKTDKIIMNEQNWNL